jgi:ethanolamine utilization protein EutN
MFLGQVIGSVWGAKQAEGLEGHKLLQVRPIRLARKGGGEEGQVTPEECELSGRILVAADTLGAGEGEYVLVATGSRVRDIVYNSRVPVKMVVVAIVDSADIALGEVA